MPSHSPFRRMVVALLLGLAVGLFSSRADWLPAGTPLHVVVALGNAIGPWVAAAFAAGAIQRRPRQGAVGGAIALVAGVVAYHVLGSLTWPGNPSALTLLVAVWLLVAAAAGSALGAAGGAWAEGRRWRTAGPVILAGALFAEAAYRFVEVKGWTGIDLTRSAIQVAAVDIIGGALVPLVLVDRSHRPVAYVGSIGLGVVGGILIAGVEALIQWAVFGRTA